VRPHTARGCMTSEFLQRVGKKRREGKQGSARAKRNPSAVGCRGVSGGRGLLGDGTRS